MFQTVSQQEPLDRTLHVWVCKNRHKWKCVLCGGVTHAPTLNDLPQWFEKLTDEERDLTRMEK